jgi:hypothetical protein
MAYSGKVLLIKAAESRYQGSHFYEWDKINNNVMVEVVRGDHNSFIKQPFVMESASIIKQYLENKE